MNSSVMEFGDGMPELEGTTWWKPDGSDHFTIRDILMSPEGFQIRATDGRLINGDVMETYIQSDVPINIPKEAPVQKINLKELDEVSEVQQVEGQKDFGSLRYKHDVQFQEPPTQRHHARNDQGIEQPAQQPQNPGGIEQAMIDRVLGKVNFDDLIAMNVNPIEKVDEGIVTLAQTLNIGRTEIKDYLTSKVTNKIKGMIDATIAVYLDELLGSEVIIEDTQESPAE